MTTEEIKRLREERGNQRLNIGDRVRVYQKDGSLRYGGRTAIIVEKAHLFEKDKNDLFYTLYIQDVTDVKKDNRGEILGHTSVFAPFFAEDLELVEYKEPREKNEESQTRKPEAAAIEIPVKVDLDATYWSAYRNDLAKEVAGKVMDGKNVKDPKMSDYVVDFAERVKERLRFKAMADKTIETTEYETFMFMKDGTKREVSVMMPNQVVSKSNEDLKVNG